MWKSPHAYFYLSFYFSAHCPGNQNHPFALFVPVMKNICQCLVHLNHLDLLRSLSVSVPDVMTEWVIFHEIMIKYLRLSFVKSWQGMEKIQRKILTESMIKKQGPKQKRILIDTDWPSTCQISMYFLSLREDLLPCVPKEWESLAGKLHHDDITFVGAMKPCVEWGTTRWSLESGGGDGGGRSWSSVDRGLSFEFVLFLF